MYSFRHIKKALENPEKIFLEINRLWHRKLQFWNYNHDGIDIFMKDWDNLIILDACRYDMFVEENRLSGETQRIQSRGTSTIEFLRGNFDGKSLHDTVYVTANPQLYQHRGQIEITFHTEKHVWREEWNEKKGTVLPETMTEYALKAAMEFPQKRLIFHYLQPHQPFLDKNIQLDMGKIAKSAEDTLEFWNKIGEATSDISKDDLWDAYVNNLNAVLASVSNLMESVDGKTVVTADHGEMISEKTAPLPVDLTGHPQGIYIPPLVEVPWHIHRDGSRRNIEAEVPQKNQYEADNAPVREQLESLGYIT